MQDDPGSVAGPIEQPLADRPSTARPSLGSLAWVFLKLGTIGFGGPAAHIAMMEQEVVRRRHWLTRDEFLDYLGATNLIPGPNSTELAMHIGQARAGGPGLVVAGVCFIFPAAVIVTALAWAYVRVGAVPAVAGVLSGLKPVVVVVVLQALVALGRTALKTRAHFALGAVATGAAAAGVPPLVVLAGAGAAMPIVLDALRPKAKGPGDRPGGVAAAIGPAGLMAVSTGIPFGLWPMFWTFLKIGSVLYGSGYVLLAFLQTDFVERTGWLTQQQLLDAVAVGQVTPGPVFTAATFIGYVLGKFPGAVVGTVGIFLPAFVFVALSGVLLPRLRRSPLARDVLDGVNVASLALMAVVTWQLGRAVLVDPVAIVIALAAAVLLIRFHINSAWVLLGGAAAGFGATWFGG